MAIHGHIFWGQCEKNGKPTKDYILLYNNIGLISKAYDGTSTERTEIAVIDQHCCLTPHLQRTANIRTLYYQKIESLGYVFAALDMGLSSFKLSSLAPKTHVF